MENIILGTVNNDDKILKIAEDYYNAMEIVYKEALEMDKESGIRYYRKKERESKTTSFTLLLPDWLKLCIEQNDHYNKEIILKHKRKDTNVKIEGIE